MFRVEVIDDCQEIEALLPKCKEFATKVKSNLPFHQITLPRLWWKHFRSQNGQDFASKRGRNFLGQRSWVDDFILIVAKKDTEIIGMVPMVKMRIAAKGQSEDIKILSFCGDSVLIFFQDFLVDPSYKEEVIKEILRKLVFIAENGDFVLFLGYLPEDSTSVPILKREIANYADKGWCGCITKSQSRGGIYPWTIAQIVKILSSLEQTINNKHPLIQDIVLLNEKLDKQTSALLSFPKTIKSLEEQVRKIANKLTKHKETKHFASDLESIFQPKDIVYPYLSLPGNKDNYFKSLSSSTRYYLRRYSRKIQEAGGIFETVEPESLKEEDIEDYLKLHLSRWGKESVAVNELTKSFHQELCHEMAQSGYLRLFFLRLAGERVAVQACLDIANRREYYFSGRAQNVTKLPVGKLLCLHTILDAIDRDFEIYDFGYGGDEYKRSFTGSKRTVISFFLTKNAMPDLNELFPKYEYMEIQTGTG